MRNHFLRRTAVAGYVGFFGLLAVATALQPPAYSSTRDFISGLAGVDATYPGVMMAGFQAGALSLAASGLLLAARLWSLPARVATGLLLVAALACSVAGFARFDCSRNDAACQARLAAGMSFHSHLHGLAALLVFLPLVVAGFWLAVAVGRGPFPRRGRLAALVFAAALVQLALTVAVEEQLIGSVGLVQRLDMVLLLGLPLVVALRAASADPTGASAGPGLASAAPGVVSTGPGVASADQATVDASVRAGVTLS